MASNVYQELYEDSDPDEVFEGFSREELEETRTVPNLNQPEDDDDLSVYEYSSESEESETSEDDEGLLANNNFEHGRNRARGRNNDCSVENKEEIWTETFTRTNLDSGGKLSTRLYDKRDDFDFHIVNFPFLSSNIPSGPSYGVYISQLIRYARCCSHYDDFRYRHKCLVDRLLSQGYKALRLEKSFKKFYGRYQDLIEKYRRSVNAMVSDSFPGQFLFNM